MIHIFPYKSNSKGAQALAAKLTAMGMDVVNNQQPNMDANMHVNWGGDLRTMSNTLNPRFSINKLTDKLAFFQHVGESEDTVPWTTDPQVAREWEKVMVRTRTAASGGRGLKVWRRYDRTPIPAAPLYTRAMPKTHEYRIHLARLPHEEDFTIVCKQRKVFRPNEMMAAPLDEDVLTHRNGYIFIRQERLRVPPAVLETVLRFAKTYFPSMHFAAFDVIYNQTNDKAYVLEGNTAPGLEGGTVDVYADYIQRVYRSIMSPPTPVEQPLPPSIETATVPEPAPAPAPAPVTAPAPPVFNPMAEIQNKVRAAIEAAVNNQVGGVTPVIHVHIHVVTSANELGVQPVTI